MTIERFRLWSGLAVFLSAPFLLSGCQSVMTSTSGSLVRVIDASTNAPPVDVLVGGSLIATNVGTPTVGNYALISPAAQSTVEVRPQGTKTIGAQAKGSFLSNQQHSIYITDAGAGYQAAVLTDQSNPAPAGLIAVRFLQNAPLTGPVDVYFVPDGSKFTDAKPVVAALAADTITAYLDIPVATYDIVVVPTGTTTAKFTGKPLVFNGGEVRTVLIVDQTVSTNPPVGVVVGDDLL